MNQNQRSLRLAERSGAVRAVLAITVVLSACSLLYELLIAQTLSLLAGNTIVWYSLTVGTYLGAMGLGAVAVGTRVVGSGWNKLFIVELLLSVVGACAVLMIQLAHSLYLFFLASPSGGNVFLFFGVSLAMVLIVGLLSGIELPLLIQLGNDASGNSKVTNRVLGWDYIGALVAGADGICEICDPGRVTDLFAGLEGNLARHHGQAAWILLLYAIWHRIHMQGVPADGDAFDVLTAAV